MPEPALPESRNVESWTLETAGATKVGGASADSRFSQVVGAVFLQNGEILIADRGEGNVRAFDSLGRYVRTVVRKGGGPEELPAITGIFRTGADSVYVNDADARSLLVLDPSGRVTRKVSDYDFRPDSIRRRSVRLKIVGALDDGSIVTSEVNTDNLRVGEQAPLVFSGFPQLNFRRGLPGGVNELTEYPRTPIRLSPTSADRNEMEFPSVSAAFGEKFYYTPGDSIVVFEYGPQGNLTRTLEVPRPRFEMQGYNLPGKQRAFHPDVLELTADDSARVWIFSYEPRSGDILPVWFVFEAGQLVSTVRSKQHVRILAIRGRTVLGVFVDSDEVPQLAIYTVTR